MYLLDYWLNTLVFSISKLNSSVCEMAQNIHFLGGVVGFFYMAKKPRTIRFILKIFFFLTAVVASILYTVEQAWLEDAESLECMQRCLGLLCLFVLM